jgi:hypothetical protein
MSLVAKGSSYEKPSAGKHNAVCANVIDLGLQSVEYKGVSQIKHQCVLMFELEDQCYQSGEHAGKHMLISRRFTVSLSPKAALRDFIEWWLGKKFPNDKNIEFDIEKLRGKYAQIEIAHNGDYANIVSASAPVKQFEPEALGYVPEWVNDVLAKRLDQPGQTLEISDDYYYTANEAFSNAAKQDGFDDRPMTEADIPF